MPRHLSISFGKNVLNLPIKSQTMNRIFYGLLYAISRLPMGVLYGFSWCIYVLLNYLIGYRRKVIFNNLKNSFPEKSNQEIKQIQKKFYKNFSDYLVETLKSLSITQKELDQRHNYSNLEVFSECKAEGKDVLLMAGHIFNWEWFIGLVKYLPTKHTLAIYHKVRNEFWNDQVNAIRGKFGTTPLDMKKTGRFMLASPNDGEQTYLFVADQSPKKANIQHSIQFLNQDTPVFIGFDKIAIRKNMAVVYANTKKVKQGYYHTTFERIEPNGEHFQPMEVVDKFFAKLENSLQENPDNWLWSHKRWKWKKGIDY